MADPDLLFDLNLNHADFHAALEDFFTRAGRAFTIDDESDIINGTITVHAADVGFKDALALMLPPDYQAVEIGEIYHIRHMPKAA